MKNAGLRAGDTASISASLDVKFGKAVLILPMKDSLDEVKLEEMDVFDSYLRPYFENKYRTLHRGDRFTVNGNNGKIEFQCVEIDTVEVDGDIKCVVADDTLIDCDSALKLYHRMQNSPGVIMEPENYVLLFAALAENGYFK